MKKITLIVILCIAFGSCKNNPQNYMTFSGEIKNLNPTDTLLSLENKEFKKEFKIQKDGTFKDTLAIKNEGYFTLFINGKSAGFTYLKNSFDLKLAADSNTFFQTIEFSGKGSSTSNYLIAQYKFGRTIGDTRKMFALDKEEFTIKLNSIKLGFDSVKKLYTDLDTTLVRTNDKENLDFINLLENSYDSQHASIIEQIKATEAISAGKPSPKFNYLNFKGGKTSLDSFKGNYVYIDIWATWCKPCIAQIPALKSIEKKYQNKKIKFVSISIDDESTAGSWDNALSKWKAMVKDKNLSGVQLYAGQDIQFMQNYQVVGIPRFLLIDPKGNIVNSNAPRPSDLALESLFKEIGL